MNPNEEHYRHLWRMLFVNAVIDSPESISMSHKLATEVVGIVRRLDKEEAAGADTTEGE